MTVQNENAAPGNAETALQLAGRDAQTIVDAAPDAMVLVDANGVIQLVNAEVERLFGHARTALVGQPIEQLIPTRFRAAHVSHLRQFALSPTPRAMGSGVELYGLRADGTEFPIDVNLNAIELSGRTLFAAAVRDIGAHHAIEAELKTAKDEAEGSAATKSRFLAAASHDLRQPLQALSMYLGVLSRGLEKPQNIRIADKMTRALGVMGGLLDALLDISKLDAGVVEPVIEPTPVQRLLNRVEAAATPQARHKGLALIVNASSDVIITDAALLQRIVDNFVGNAIRYTEAGTVEISCRAHQGALRIEVSDTGVGIPASALESIFGEYVQLDNPARDRTRGLGLGLSIVKRIADLLGHRIDVRSRPGEGSTFSVEVPLSSEGTMAVSNPPAQLNAAQREDISVLYVEDDPMVLEATQALLNTVGFEVRAATTIAAALAAVQGQASPDVILSDFRLQDDEWGTDMVKQMRTVLGADIPAIIMTGDTSRQQIEATALPRCEVLHKPVDSDQLIALIEKIAQGG